MQDRPNADELAEAVGEFLRSEVAPAVADPRLRFRVLIAANLMTILTRELQAGDEPVRAEWQALAALLGAPGGTPPAGADLRAEADRMARELCARIRAGEADEGPWAEAVQAYAEDALTARLRIANPRFLARIGG
jgi:AcrR family transcriptional regulator